MKKDIENDSANLTKEDNIFKEKLLQITLKIYYDSISHDIEFKKNDTIIK